MRNQSWAKPGQVCFRRFALLCVGGVDAAGLQIGTGSVDQGGPAPGNKGTWPPTLAVDGGWQGRFHTVPPNKGQSTLVSGRPGRRESRRRHPRAPGLPTPAHRLCVPQGGVPKAGPPSSRCMQFRSQEAPGSAPRAGGQLASRCSDPHPPPSGWARVRIRRRAQYTAQPGISAAIRRRPRGSRPAPGRTSLSGAAPGATAAPKQPRAHQPLTFSALTRGASQPRASRPRPSTGPRPLSSVPGSPSHSGARSRGRVRTSVVPTVRTPLWARDRPI
ncbi:hypothetical protein NDU88_006468 [Pleurodeles waltl]|uniref:Uncharacterized protein n=1 Tax=Pleurodeles waltl TaxID=8319 RepID=A0AAV7X1R5_PLEWA|nr:hypothetical protein NDU88_006468 [Pleurodeles waltl]